MFLISNISCCKISKFLLDEISGSNDGEYEDNCLLGCCAAVWSVSSLLAFQTHLLPPSAGLSWAMALMLEVASASETSVNFYEATSSNNIPEDSHLAFGCSTDLPH
jgi:hypothetical protein